MGPFLENLHLELEVIQTVFRYSLSLKICSLRHVYCEERNVAPVCIRHHVYGFTS